MSKKTISPPPRWGFLVIAKRTPPRRWGSWYFLDYVYALTAVALMDWKISEMAFATLGTMT